MVSVGRGESAGEVIQGDLVGSCVVPHDDVVPGVGRVASGPGVAWSAGRVRVG